MEGAPVRGVHRDWPFRTVVPEAHERRKSTFSVYEQATLLRHRKAVAEGIDIGPDGDYQLDAHLRQLAYHPCWIRVLLLKKALHEQLLITLFAMVLYS